MLFSCPGCAVVIRAGPEWATRKVACPRCPAAFAVPELPECELVRLVAAPSSRWQRIRRRLWGAICGRTPPAPVADYGN